MSANVRCPQCRSTKRNGLPGPCMNFFHVPDQTGPGLFEGPEFERHEVPAEQQTKPNKKTQWTQGGPGLWET